MGGGCCLSLLGFMHHKPGCLGDIRPWNFRHWPAGGATLFLQKDKATWDPCNTLGAIDLVLFEYILQLSLISKVGDNSTIHMIRRFFIIRLVYIVYGKK